MNDMSFSGASPLDDWFNVKPTLGLMGEFSAGKSTLLNLILNNDILQTRVTATNMPVIWLTYAPDAKAESLSRDGNLQEFDIDTLDEQGAQDHLVIRLALPCAVLEKVDIIDTPGISDSRLQAGALDFLSPYLDSVIWCSAANQAWRQSEKAMWMSLPAELRSKSLLALTRADMLRKKTDLQKVIRRCEREAADLFAKVIPISASVALEAREEGGDVPEPRKWLASHATVLFDEINEIIDIISKDCTARRIQTKPAELPSEKAEIEPKKKLKTAVKPKSAKKKTTAKAATKDKPQAKRSSSKGAKTTSPESNGSVSNLISELCQLRETIPHNKQFFTELDHILNSFSGDKKTSEGQRRVLNLTLSSDWNENMPKTELMAQLIRELNDFGNNTWYALDQIY